MVSSLMLIVVERRETFHYYYPMGVHPPGDLTVTLCETACFVGLILALHIFAHFLHIARMDNRCKDVQAMQRMQQNNNDKITVIRLK